MTARLWSTVVLCGAAASCQPAALSGPDAAANDAAVTPALSLLRERKLSKLLGAAADHYEASGVHLRNGQLYVAMDNLRALAVVSPDLLGGTLVGEIAGPSQYEGIADCPNAPLSLCVMEETDDAAVPRGLVVEMNEAGTIEGALPTDVPFVNPNRGFEGLALVNAPEGPRLLALCEGNRCQDDVASEGEGEIKVLAPTSQTLTSIATLAVPALARFHDYADLAVRDRPDGDYDVAVVSQLSSALWIGRLRTATWSFVGDGVVYGLPRTASGVTQYCNVEGVTFLDESHVVLASDKSDGTTPCNDKDESLSVFALP